MDISIKICTATKEHLAQVYAVDQLCFKEGYNRLVLRQIFDLAPQYFLVALSGENVVAYCCAATGEDLGELWILSLAVHPDWRHRGVALALAQHVARIGQNRGVTEMRFTVRPDNLAVQLLAHSFGFSEVEEEVDYFGSGEARQVMRWQRSEQSENTLRKRLSITNS